MIADLARAIFYIGTTGLIFGLATFSFGEHAGNADTAAYMGVVCSMFIGVPLLLLFLESELHHAAHA